jgi:hypothetical protein
MSDLPEAITFDLESPAHAIWPYPHLPSMNPMVFDIVPLVYNDNMDATVIKNVLLIDNTVQEYQQFVDGCNANTFPIVYDYHSDRNELKSLLARKFSSIQRIAFVFHNAGMNGKLFLNNQCFFNGSETQGNFSENFQVLVDIIRDFRVGHVDYLACNSLQYDNWKQYYELLKTTANVIIGASNDATGNIQYGGDWVMESTSEDIKTMYFNDNIDEYTKTLEISIISESTTVTNAELNDSSLYTWPITINGGTASSRVVITFGDNITLNNANQYFIIGSDYVTIDGGNKMVTISGVTDYPGLIQNGDGVEAFGIGTGGKSNITVENINIQATNESTLSQYEGWICQYCFCSGSSGINTISNCANTGDITTNETGGIVGSFFANGSQIGSKNTIINCTNSGHVLTIYSGGIASSGFAYGSSGINIITNCTNSGTVSGDYSAGGIAGIGFAFGSSGINAITNCTNSGRVSGDFTGGITGDLFAQESSGTNTINNCYTLYGAIGPSNQYLSNTYEAYNEWSSENALQNLLITVDNVYVWAYPKVNGVDQKEYSPFLLYSLNPNNTPVGYIPPPNPPSITNILPNQITGTYVPNSTVVVTETTTNNETITSQIQSDAQGIWNFNVSNPANNYSFAPLNATQFVNTLTSSYSFRYPQAVYTLTLNTPLLIKPRQNGINPLDQRSWRISPKLPTGLKFSSISGIISGTPTQPAPSTRYNIWSNSEIFLSCRRQLTIEIV